jgi:hypothetical protein
MMMGSGFPQVQTEHELQEELAALERDLAAALLPGLPAIAPRPYVPKLKEVLAAYYPLMWQPDHQLLQGGAVEWLVIHPEPDSKPPP